MARPQKEIKWEVVLARMQAGNTAKQICQHHHVDTDTFYRRFKQEFGCSFGDYSAAERDLGNGNVAFMQYTKAMQGNTSMLLRLGDEWLGQGAPKVQNLAANQPTIDYEHIIMELQNKIATLIENADKSKTE